MHNDKLGHNKPPKTIDELIHNGRIELKNSIIKKLKRKVDDNGNYIYPEGSVFNYMDKVNPNSEWNCTGGKVS